LFLFKLNFVLANLNSYYGVY